MRGPPANRYCTEKRLDGPSFRGDFQDAIQSATALVQFKMIEQSKLQKLLPATGVIWAFSGISKPMVCQTCAIWFACGSPFMKTTKVTKTTKPTKTTQTVTNKELSAGLAEITETLLCLLSRRIL